MNTRPTTLLLDVEGTTTQLQFVHEVLFPYAQHELHNYLMANTNHAGLTNLLEAVSRENPQHPPEHTLQQWMANDVKHPLLKTLQGWLWESGYQQGVLQGHVYDDVLPAFSRWTAQGLQLGIYSSGSILAQQLLFKHSIAGNLRPYLSHHFDTGVGPKQQASSYGTIAQHLGQAPDGILFLSDIAPELQAAQQAGMAVMQVCRADNPNFIAGGGWPVIPDFKALF
jgi:enolase-phosphatase E1